MAMTVNWRWKKDLSVFPIDGVPPSSASIHLRCFEHLKWDMLAELKRLEQPKGKQNYIVRRILGGEFQGKRLKGLVDVEDGEFGKEWANIKKELPPAFSEWMKSTKGRIRSQVHAEICENPCWPGESSKQVRQSEKRIYEQRSERRSHKKRN